MKNGKKPTVHVKRTKEQIMREVSLKSSCIGTIGSMD